MSGILTRYKGGPRSYQVNAAVKGGQVVVPDGSTGKVKPCNAAAATNVLGVALVDALPAASQDGNTTSYGMPVVDVSVPQDTTSVAYGGMTVPVTYSGTVAFGQKVQADATGGVQAWVNTGNGSEIIGVCEEPGGMVAGQVGLVRLV